MCRYLQWICATPSCNNPISGPDGILDVFFCQKTLRDVGTPYRGRHVLGWCGFIIYYGTKKHGPNRSLCDSCLAKWQEDDKKDKEKRARDFFKKTGLDNPKDNTPPAQSQGTESTSGGAQG
jgi:hypothetical protein